MAKNYRKDYSVETLFEGILNSDRMLLGKSITYIESRLNSDRQIAKQIVAHCLPHAGNSIRIGITGVPGAGKSTFIEALGKYLIENENKKVAVLAVDPSSKMSKGSILGDKTRMNYLATSENAFIRPSPTSGFLGGVAASTKESMVLLEAAGYNVIIIETVGVGQSEIEVSEMVDFFLLLMLSGAGDQLQGIKRGIMEMADAIIFNKAEEENLDAVKMAMQESKSVLKLYPPKNSGWTTKVNSCSALQERNIDKVWGIIQEYIKLTKKNNYFEENRAQQNLNWFKSSINKFISLSLNSNKEFMESEKELSKEVKEGKISPFEASEILFQKLKITYSQ